MPPKIFSTRKTGTVPQDEAPPPAGLPRVVPPPGIVPPVRESPLPTKGNSLTCHVPRSVAPPVTAPGIFLQTPINGSVAPPVTAPGIFLQTPMNGNLSMHSAARVVPPPMMTPSSNITQKDPSMRSHSINMDCHVRKEENSSAEQTPCLNGPRASDAHACSNAQRRVTLVEDLKERLVKRRRTEDLERPPGIFDAPPGNWSESAAQLPMAGPPGDWSVPASGTRHRDRERDRDRDQQDRGRRRRDRAFAKDRDHAGPRTKVRYADHCRRRQSSDKQTDIPASAHGEQQQGAFAKARGAAVADASQKHAQTPSNEAAAAPSEHDDTQGQLHMSSSGNDKLVVKAVASKIDLARAPWRTNTGASTADSNTVGPVANAAPWQTSAPSPVPPPISGDAWGKNDQSAFASREAVEGQDSSMSAPGLLSEIETQLLNEINKVKAQPDIGELLHAVNQVAPEVIASSPESVDDSSEGDDSVTEDSDYDPFDVGPSGQHYLEQEGEDEDEGIVEALFEMMRSAETVAPEASVAASYSDNPSSPVAAAFAESKEQPRESEKEPSTVPGMENPDVLEDEHRPKPQMPASAYKFNPKTQRWEPKREPSTPETHHAPKHVPEKRMATPIATIDLIGDEEKPKDRPQKSFDIAMCEAQARSDAAGGVVSYPQALAVRLVLRFESKPGDMLKTMEEAGLPAAKDQRSTVKAIMRLCHPDKCKHLLAKRAMQALVPLLS